MDKRSAGARRSNREHEALLDILAQTGDVATRAQIEAFRAPGVPKRKRGRPPIADVKYRALARRWRDFERANRRAPLDQKLSKFWREFGKQTKEVFGLSLNKRSRSQENQYGSLRGAIRRGKKASLNMRERRRRDWRVAPAGLAAGVQSHISNVLYVEMAKRALLSAYMPSLSKGLFLHF
jgi:hypothetical protein